MKADVNVAGSRRSRATVGSQYQMRGDDDYNENGDTNEIINDPEHQNDDNTVSGSRASINPEAQINDHETPPNDGHHKTQPNDVQVHVLISYLGRPVPPIKACQFEIVSF